MNIRLFARYVQDAQEHNYYDKTQLGFIDDTAKHLFTIRDSYEYYDYGMKSIEREKNKSRPNLVKIANIRRRIASKTRDASISMVALNNETVKRFGRQLFDYSGGLYVSTGARAIIRKDSREYSEQLNERIRGLPIPEEKRETEFEDRVFVESYLWEEHFQERDLAYEDPTLDETPIPENQHTNRDLDTTPVLVRPVSEPDIDETPTLEPTSPDNHKEEKPKSDDIRFHTQEEFEAFLNSGKKGVSGIDPGNHDAPGRSPHRNSGHEKDDGMDR